jgi:Lhr-like helicase
MLRWLTRHDPEHPLLEEAWQEALHDALDLEGAEALRARLVAGSLPLVFVERRIASPLSARLAAPRGEARWSVLRDHHEMLDAAEPSRPASPSETT